MLRGVSFALALASCVFLVACSNSMNSSAPVSNGVPMSLTIGDTPPSGVAVLFFEALITGVSLHSSTTNASAPVMITPVEVEFGHLQTDTAFLSLVNVNPDTYDSMTLTFGSATMTIINHSGGMIGTTCAKDAVCELTPSFTSSMATISSAPFPIMISKDSVVGIRLDFDVNSSVGTDLSINPMVTVKQLTQRKSDEDGQEMENVDEVDGQVTEPPMNMNNQFKLMNERSGQSFTIMVDTNTKFEDFDRAGCTTSPADINCVKMGQILDVDLSENGMGMMLAKRVEFEEDANKEAIKGTITSVDSTTPQTVFHMVVFNEEPAMGGISEGSTVMVTVDSNAMFQVGREEMGEDGGFSMPGLSFASGADLLVGQDVQIRPEMVSSSGGTTTVTTNLVRLWPSQISGKVGTVNNDGTFTLTILSPLFTGATPPITTINVVTLSGMNLEDSQGSGSPGSLTVGTPISVKGLLFNTTGTTGMMPPTLVTRTAREHTGD